MLEIGDRVPTATVWTAPGQPREVHELLADGAALFLFYLFDWSAT